jgi:prepilin-type N-terminal cleavage/methylation domain-containing protein
MSAPLFPRAARGFTLVEVMITLVILAFGLLTLAAMQLAAMKQGSAGRHTSDGAAIARSYLEQAARQPWATLTAAQGAGWVDPVWANEPSAQITVNRPGGAAASTEHAYTVTWRVTDVGASPTCLRDVEVRVTWAEQGYPAGRTHLVGTRRYNHGDASC